MQRFNGDTRTLDTWLMVAFQFPDESYHTFWHDDNNGMII